MTTLLAMSRDFVRRIAVIAFLSLPGMAMAQAQNVLDDYVLDTGDKISIQVFDESDLTLSSVIGDSGSINYSYLGILQVSGKTPAQLETEITALLKDGYLVNPSVNVTVDVFRPFYIYGEVRRPGGYPYQPGLTIEKAIALAGGLTDRASLRKVFLARVDQSGSSGESRVNLNAQVNPDDVITIKEGFF